MHHTMSRRRRTPARTRGWAVAIGLCAGQLLGVGAAAATPADPAYPGGLPGSTDPTVVVATAPGDATATAVPAPGDATAATGAVDQAGDTGAVDPAPDAAEAVEAVLAGRVVAVGGTARARTARERVLAEAARLRGRPYRYGAAGPRAFDCSGFTQYVFRKAGKRLPHSADAQQRRGRKVARGQARPGDLMIFRRGGYGYHAAIYAGGGYMYDAPRPGARVGKHRVWSRDYVIRRLV